MDAHKREAAELLHRAYQMLKTMDQALLVAKADAFDIILEMRGGLAGRPEPIEHSARRLQDQCHKLAEYIFMEMRNQNVAGKPDENVS